ncbi:hypothetical protein H6G04_19490 [Calothrix membranacea FACHB-236]|nr:hypothetical protein [Calothrix membranacea FACHB-236]
MISAFDDEFTKIAIAAGQLTAASILYSSLFILNQRVLTGWASEESSYPILTKPYLFIKKQFLFFKSLTLG